MLFLRLALLAVLTQVVRSDASRGALHDRLKVIAHEVSFGDNIKLYGGGTFKNNGAGNAVLHAQVVAMGHVSPHKATPTSEDLQIRSALSLEYHQRIHQIFFGNKTNRIAPLRVTVLVLVGDKRRDIWTRSALPKVCIMNRINYIKVMSCHAMSSYACLISDFCDVVWLL